MESENSTLSTNKNTHVDVDPVPVEDGRLGVVRRDEPVELVAVAVPLDGVQLVALHVVAAPQLGVLAPDGVRRDRHLQQLDGPAGTCETRRER